MNLKTIIYIIIISQIIFNLTLLKGEYILEPNSDDYPYTVYGHFIPFMREGVNSLSMQFDVIRYSIEQFIFILITTLIIHFYKIKLNKLTILSLCIVCLISSLFVYIILVPDTSLQHLDENFDLSTITSYWIK